MYRVELSRRARSDIRRLDRSTQARLLERFDLLAQDPYDREHSKPLQGREGLRSSRVGGLRILYFVEDEVRVVAVTDIGPRGDIYGGASG